MKKQMYMGLGILIVLLGIATVFLLKDKDTEPIKVYNQPSEEVMQKIRDDLATQKAAKPLPQGEKQSTGHQHADGTWHDEPHKPIVVSVGNQQPSYDPDDTWRLYPDNIWRKKGEHAIPNTVPQELKLPEDIFSDSYTDGVKKLVQTYVEYRNTGDLRSHALRGEIHKVNNAMARLWNLYYSDEENNRYARERREELKKLLEPYKALIPKPTHPTPFEKYGDPREIKDAKIIMQKRLEYQRLRQQGSNQ